MSTVRINVLIKPDQFVVFITRLFLIRNVRKIATDEKNRSINKINHRGTIFIVLRKLIVVTGVAIGIGKI
jgi:hypothetical protein